MGVSLPGLSPDPSCEAGVVVRAALAVGAVLWLPVGASLSPGPPAVAAIAPPFRIGAALLTVLPIGDHTAVRGGCPGARRARRICPDPFAAARGGRSPGPRLPCGGRSRVACRTMVTRVVTRPPAPVAIAPVASSAVPALSRPAPAARP